MTTMGLFAIFDRKAEYSQGPWVAANDEVAKRMFAALVADDKTEPGKFPADFDLRRVGTWCPHSTEILLHDRGVEIIAIGTDFAN